MGFNTFVVNLLTIPSKVLGIIGLLILTYFSEVLHERSMVALFAQIWVLPFVVYLYVCNINEANKWVAFAIMTLLLAYPSGKFNYPFLE